MRRHGEGGSGGSKLSTTRMEAFSDGVFAIAITLLVLDLVAPSLKSDVGRALIDAWPSYAGYIVSFATIGAAWIAHVAITDHMDHADALFLRVNLVVLLFVSVLPFPTRMIAEYESVANPERIAVTIYGINLLLIAASLSGLWRYAVAEHLVKEETPDEHVESITSKLTPSLGLYLGAIVIGLFAPRAAAALYLAIALFMLIPFRSLVRAKRRRAT